MAEVYQGVKFKTVFLTKLFIPKNITKKLINIGEHLSDAGFCPLNSGNISVRYRKGFVITNANSILGNLKTNDFIFVEDIDFEKKKVFCLGNNEPSSETMMHKMIYDDRCDINCILHAHSLDFGGNIPVTEKEYLYGTPELALSAVKILKSNDIVILKNHGFIAIGHILEDAFSKVKSFA